MAADRLSSWWWSIAASHIRVWSAFPFLDVFFLHALSLAFIISFFVTSSYVSASFLTVTYFSVSGELYFELGISNIWNSVIFWSHMCSVMQRKRYEVFTAANLKSGSCELWSRVVVVGYRRFGEPCCLRLRLEASQRWDLELNTLQNITSSSVTMIFYSPQVCIRWNSAWHSLVPGSQVISNHEIQQYKHNSVSVWTVLRWGQE
jgi:hypothetical protein